MVIILELMILTVAALLFERHATKKGNMTKKQWFKRIGLIGAVIIIATIGFDFLRNYDLIATAVKQGYLDGIQDFTEF